MLHSNEYIRAQTLGVPVTVVDTNGGRHPYKYYQDRYVPDGNLNYSVSEGDTIEKTTNDTLVLSADRISSEPFFKVHEATESERKLLSMTQNNNYTFGDLNGPSVIGDNNHHFTQSNVHSIGNAIDEINDDDSLSENDKLELQQLLIQLTQKRKPLKASFKNFQHGLKAIR